MPRFNHPTLGTWTIGVRRLPVIKKTGELKRYLTQVLLQNADATQSFQGESRWKIHEDQFCARTARGIAFKRALESMAHSGMPEGEFLPLKNFLKASFRRIQAGKRIRSSRPVESVPPGAEPQVSAMVM